ncbi:hypothetical protein OAS39_00390 [Pirellulales bacterium]|nr:hypothetical protein [Pirellulales bacterium]
MAETLFPSTIVADVLSLRGSAAPPSGEVKAATLRVATNASTANSLPKNKQAGRQEQVSKRLNE